MTKLKTFTAFLLLLLLISCSNEKEALLLGNWQGISWIIEGADSGRNADSVKFTFEDTGSYKGSWGDKTEVGVFDLQGDKLYTTEEGKLKKMVKINQIGTDTLVMLMNRVGTDEKLILVRK